MDEHQYDIAKTVIKTYIDEKTVKAFGSVFEEHCCNPVVDNVIKMLGYIVKALPEYRHIDDIEIYKTLISIFYGLHYIESSRDIYKVVITDMYVDLSVKDVYSHGKNLSSLIRRFFLLPNPRWNDVIVEIVELYLQVCNNPDLIKNIYVISDDEDKLLIEQYITKKMISGTPLVGTPLVEDPLVEDPLVEDPLVEDPLVEDPLVLQYERHPRMDESMEDHPLVQHHPKINESMEDPLVQHHPKMDESNIGGYKKTRKRFKRKTKKSVKNKINRQRTKYSKKRHRLQ